MTARRLVLVLVAGSAVACGGRRTSRDAGGPPGDDAAADAHPDAAPGDAGSENDAGLDASTDAGRCLLEVCECGGAPGGIGGWTSCPSEARYCCEPKESHGQNPQCFPSDDPGPGPSVCRENPLDSGEPSDCREDDNDASPWTYVDHSERCPDERPNCCGLPPGPVLCADHVLIGWSCGIGVSMACADNLGEPDSTRCPDDHPWCCVSEKTGGAWCSAHDPPPEGWRCDVD